jgi:hypothetical protein
MYVSGYKTCMSLFQIKFSRRETFEDDLESNSSNLSNILNLPISRAPFAYHNVLSDFISGQACLSADRGGRALMERREFYNGIPAGV